MPTSDGVLLQRAHANDREAIGELLERHGPQVRRILTGSIPKRWEPVLTVDDVLQQTYTDAFLAIGRFRAEDAEAFPAWLSKLAKRNLVDALRMLRAGKRGGDRNRVLPDAHGDSVATLYELFGATSGTPSREAAISESKTALAQAMDRLPPAYRTVIRLYDLENRPVEEVAALLDRSVGAVYMLRARAHERLADLMGSASLYFTDAP
jgi:RNA polymerase sigma-70 factor (ECF subfamily)